MLIVLVLLAALFTAFIVENQAPVTVEFLAWRYNLRLGVALVGAMVVGAIVIFLAFMGRQLSLQAQMRNAETRAHNAEAKLREAARQREISTSEES
jgi:uncharacterized integral membrane protein